MTYPSNAFERRREKLSTFPTNNSEFSENPVAKKLRDSVCPVNPRRYHRWSKDTKLKVSASQYIQLLRCRYCANYLQVTFERVVLPSGRVTVQQRLDIVKNVHFEDHTSPLATNELHNSTGFNGPSKTLDSASFESHTMDSHLHNEPEAGR